MGLVIVNFREVVTDMSQYDKDTRKAFLKTMRGMARRVQKNQKANLRAGTRSNAKSRRGRWKLTGNLLRSITIKREKAAKYGITIAIGPGQQKYTPLYARFIEEGGQPFDNPNAAPFRGYHYVKNSTSPGLAKLLKARLLKDVKDNLKK